MSHTWSRDWLPLWCNVEAAFECNKQAGWERQRLCTSPDMPGSWSCSQEHLGWSGQQVGDVWGMPAVTAWWCKISNASSADTAIQHWLCDSGLWVWIFHKNTHVINLRLSSGVVKHGTEVFPDPRDTSSWSMCHDKVTCGLRLPFSSCQNIQNIQRLLHYDMPAGIGKQQHNQVLWNFDWTELIKVLVWLRSMSPPVSDRFTSRVWAKFKYFPSGSQGWKSFPAAIVQCFLVARTVIDPVHNFACTASSVIVWYQIAISKRCIRHIQIHLTKNDFVIHNITAAEDVLLTSTHQYRKCREVVLEEMGLSNSASCTFHVHVALVIHKSYYMSLSCGSTPMLNSPAFSNPVWTLALWALQWNKASYPLLLCSIGLVGIAEALCRAVYVMLDCWQKLPHQLVTSLHMHTRQNKSNTLSFVYINTGRVFSLFSFYQNYEIYYGIIIWNKEENLQIITCDWLSSFNMPCVSFDAAFNRILLFIQWLIHRAMTTLTNNVSLCNQGTKTEGGIYVNR